jgi:putative spermidine/putrescine transport system substrate-binding protein
MDPRIPDDASDLSRRQLLKRAGFAGGALISLPAFLAACGSDGATSTAAATTATGESDAFTTLLAKTKSKQVIIATYGGDTEAARKEIFWDPFTKASGIKVIEADAGALGDQMLSGEIPTKWDAFHGSTSESRQSQLTGKKPLPKTPEAAWEDLIETKYQPYMWQSFYVGYFPAYITGTFKGDQPTTWADFFDVEKFPGKRSWPGAAYTSATREAALMADGVAPKDVYPLDIPRADKKIKSIWDHFVFYDQFPQVQSYLTSKTVAISFGPNAMWKQLRDKGVDVTTLDGATPVLEANGMNIMPDPPNLDAVQLLAVYCNDPERQAAFAKATNYGPPTKAAFSKLTDAEKKLLPNAPGRETVVMDTEYLGSVQDELAKDNKKLFS